MLLTPSDPDIQTIATRIRNGDIDLQPDFQRGEVWSTGKKKRLIDSILRNWHIPPIHTVVVPESGKQEVLDGQQRLAAIRDFVDNILPVDGNIPPYNPSIQALHNLKYRDLPENVRRRFDAFTVRVIRITDHQPEEPGELFFRLNQITNVTAAEQRNAFYGPVRGQVKGLVATFINLGNNQDTLGFSNSRMAYDDVISKFLCTIEYGTLNEKLTASVISDRFRSKAHFSDQVYQIAENAVYGFSTMRQGLHKEARFNKATLLSWLIFTSSFTQHGRYDLLDYYGPSFMSWFEEYRGSHQYDLAALKGFSSLVINEINSVELISIFNDRSTSRVLDVSSVIYRDLILHLMFWAHTGTGITELPISYEKRERFDIAISVLRDVPHFLIEETFEKIIDFSVWGALR